MNKYLMNYLEIVHRIRKEKFMKNYSQKKQLLEGIN